MQKLDTLQAGRALAAISVLLFHANATLAFPEYIGREIAPFFHSGFSGVNYFFVLSGFVIFLGHHHEIGRPECLGAFLWKRFRRVYPPLWVVLALLAVVFVAVPSFRHDGSLSFGTIISPFLVLPASRENLLSVEWTLRHEMLFYLVFGLLIWNRKIGYIVGSIWVLISIISIPLHFIYPLSFIFSSNHALFAFGVLAARSFVRGDRVLPTPIFATGLLMFALTWIVLWLKNESNWGLEEADLANISFGIAAALIVFGAAKLELVGRIRVPASLVFLGEASYSIYLIHDPAVSVISRITAKLNGKVPDIIIFLLTAAFALSAGVIFYVLIERRILKLLPRSLRILRQAPVTSSL